MMSIHCLLQELKAKGEQRFYSLLSELLVDNVVQNYDDANVLLDTNSWRQHLVVQSTYNPQDVSAFVSLVQAILSSVEEDLYEEKEIFHMLESIEEENENEEEEEEC